MINIPALVDLHKEAKKHLYLFEYIMCAVLKIDAPEQSLSSNSNVSVADNALLWSLEQ